MERQGAIVLSDAELLSLITGVPDLGAADQLLGHMGGLAGLYATRPDALRGKVAGVGPVAIARLNAAFELGRRLLARSLDAPGQPLIRSPADLAALLMLEMGSLEQEHLRVVCLNSHNRVQRITTLYVGSLTQAGVRIGEVFREPIARTSAAIILAHNHPSGDLDVSDSDIALTAHVREAGELLNIPLLDHLIIGKGRFVSLASLGYAGFAL